MTEFIFTSITLASIVPVQPAIYQLSGSQRRPSCERCFRRRTKIFTPIIGFIRPSAHWAQTCKIVVKLTANNVAEIRQLRDWTERYHQPFHCLVPPLSHQQITELSSSTAAHDSRWPRPSTSIGRLLVSAYVNHRSQALWSQSPLWLTQSSRRPTDRGLKQTLRVVVATFSSSNSRVAVNCALLGS